MDTRGILLFTIAILTVKFVGEEIYHNRHNLHFILKIWRGFRPRVVIEAAIILALAAIVAGTLLEIPILNWGWLRQVTGSDGTIMLSPVAQRAYPGHLLMHIMLPLFLLALLVANPFLVKVEEEFFRKGHLRWPAIIWQSLKFGAAHLLVGIAFAYAITLVGIGFYLACKYRGTYRKRIAEENAPIEAEGAALLSSMTLHACFNSLLLVWFAVAAIATI